MITQRNLSLPRGLNGAPGLDGIYGGYSFPWKFVATAGSAVNTGEMRFNNTDYTSVTRIAFSLVSIDGADLGDVITSITATLPYYIRIYSEYSPLNFAVYKLISVAGTGLFNVQYVARGGAFSTTTKTVVSFTPYNNIYTESVQTTDAVPTAMIPAVPILTGMAMIADVNILGFDGTDAFSASFVIGVMNIGGTMRVIDMDGSLSKETVPPVWSSGAATWDYDDSLDNTAKTFKLSVTGEVGKTITWQATVNCTNQILIV